MKRSESMLPTIKDMRFIPVSERRLGLEGLRAARATLLGTEAIAGAQNSGTDSPRSVAEEQKSSIGAAPTELERIKTSKMVNERNSMLETMSNEERRQVVADEKADDVLGRAF